jgi:hypothetical protein
MLWSMAGFLIYQSGKVGDARASLASAHHWFTQEKRLPIVGSIEEPGVSVVKYGRRCSRSAAVAQLPDGWLASIGYWTHPRLQPNDNTALLKLLGQGRPSVLEELDGMYAIAWYARSTSTLTIATDHIGRLHVFYAINSAGIFVSSSCTALARAVASDPDPVAVYEMLATGTIFEDRTPFRQIRRIPAASVLEFRNGLLCHTTVHNDLMSASPAESALGAEELLEVLENSVRVLLDPYENPLSDLTGGYDSRLVLGLFLRLHRTVTVTVSGPSTDPDVRVAKELARRVGVPIEVAGPELTQGCQNRFDDVLRATVLSEGGFDPIAYTAIERIHSAHAEHFDVSVNGSGGELLRNYWWDRSHIRGASQDVVAEGAQRFARGAVVSSIVTREFRFDLVRHFEEVVARCLDHVKGAPAYAKLDRLYLLLRMQCLIGSIASATNQIWTPAAPLLQRASLKAVLRLNPLLRLDAKVMRQMYALCSTTLATYPLETGFPPMAMSLPSLWRFVPGLMKLPFVLRRRLQARSRWAGGSDEASAALVRALFASGAADYFHFPTMALRFCLGQHEFDRFLDAARKTGKVSPFLVGRLIALESVYRAASGRR